MDLSAIIVPDAVKHPTPIITCTIEGILDEEDLRNIVLEPMMAPPDGTAQPASLGVEDDPRALKRIKEKHHSVARMIASGVSNRLVATLCGFTENYISILLNNPAMQELVEMYRIQNGAAAQVITEKLQTIGLKAAEKLEEKLDEDKLTNQELLGAAKLGLDRSGHGPQSKHHVTSEAHTFDHAKIAELNLEARRRSSGYIVPVSEVRGAVLPAPKTEENQDGEA